MFSFENGVVTAIVVNGIYRVGTYRLIIGPFFLLSMNRKLAIIIQINYSLGFYDILRNKTLFPTTFSVGVHQYAVLIEVFSALFSYFQWTSICLIRDVKPRSPFYDIWLTSNNANYSRIKFVNKNGGSMNLRHYSIHTKPYSSSELQDALLDASKYGRSEIYATKFRYN